MDKSKILGPAIDKDSLESSLRFRVEENGGYTREISALRDKKSFGVLKLHKKGKKVYSKRRKSDNIRIDHFGDEWKSCSHMGNGLNDTDMKEDIDIEVSNPRLEQSSLGKCKTKRNKKLFFGGMSQLKHCYSWLFGLIMLLGFFLLLLITIFICFFWSRLVASYGHY